MNDARRICKMDYKPTIGILFHPVWIQVNAQRPSVEDTLRAYLTTVGVEEHRLSREGDGNEQNPQEWVIYDVGGSRTQRGKYAFISGFLCRLHFDRHLDLVL
jgi:hypothetical protein